MAEEKFAWQFQVCAASGRTWTVTAPNPHEAAWTCVLAHRGDVAAGMRLIVLPQEACPFPPTYVDVQQGTEDLALHFSVDPIEFLEVAASLARKKLLAEQRRYVTGPIVTHRGSWAGEVPEWLRQAIPGARVRQVFMEILGFAKEDEGLATLEEVSAYMMTASLEAPLTYDAALIYFWAAAHVLAAHGKAESPEEIFAKLDLGFSRERPFRLTEYQERDLLRRLQRDLRQSTANHSRAAAKSRAQAGAAKCRQVPPTGGSAAAEEE